MTLLRIAPFLLAAIAFGAPCLHAQRDFNVWCFGGGAGIDFNGPVPVAIPTGMQTIEGSASVCDPVTGTLLFYTDGVGVYDARHTLMPNGGGVPGTELYGNLSSTQAATIIPAPGAAGRFYVITADAGPYDGTASLGIHYSVVDMSLRGGLGDVTVRNAALLDSATEKVVVVRNANACSFWIICHGAGNDAYYAYSLGLAGLDTVPVISHAGSVHSESPTQTPGLGTLGYLKASPDGTMLAAALYARGIVDLLRFNSASGVVSSWMSLPACDEPYGITFTADSRELYISCHPSALYRCRADTPDSAATMATLAFVTDTSAPTPLQRYGALQLAPDGRIYHARNGGTWVGTITAGRYEPLAIDLGRGCRLGLPNLIDGLFASGTVGGGTLTCNAPAVNFTPGDTAICAGTCLDFTDRTTNSPVEWQWTFQGASAGSSSSQNPTSICFPNPGDYQVTLVARNAAGGGSLTRIIHVVPAGNLFAEILDTANGAPGITSTASPGDTIVLEARLQQAFASPLASLRVGLRFDPTVLRPLAVESAGGVLDSWRVDSMRTNQADGSLWIAYSAPAGSPPGGVPLAGAGMLARVRFQVFLGQNDSAHVRLAVASAASPCLAAAAPQQNVHVVGCAVRDRLFQLGHGSFALGPVAPNPFNPAAVISYAMPFDAHASITVRDAVGRQVAVLLDADVAAGGHTVTWDASAMPSGLYYCILRTGDMARGLPLVLAR